MALAGSKSLAGLKAVPPGSARSAPAPAGKYIGTVKQIKGRQFAARLGRNFEVHKKKVQVAAVQGKKSSGIGLPASQNPVYVWLYDSFGVKKSRAKLSYAKNSKTMVFELVKGQPQPAVGWRIGLEDLSLLTTDGKSFGLGLFYELKWK